MKQKTKFKFFIVDDDVFIINVYEQYLKNIGYEDITAFSNGKECLDSLHTNPDIIILDHGLHELTGLEILNKIKRINPNIYVIMISGQEDTNIVMESMKHGAFDYIVKNKLACIRLQETIERIEKILLEFRNDKNSNGGSWGNFKFKS